MRRRIWLGLAVAVAWASLAHATVVQRGNLRITVLSQILPYKLPRHGAAPIAVFVSGHLEAPHGGIPAQLQRLTVAVNRHGRLQFEGLPTCRLFQIEAATTERALATCGDAVIGSGQFWAHIVLPDQDAYPTHGRLLIFNGREHGRPVLYTYIFTSDPFLSSFVLDFKVRKIRTGAWGTELSASLPEALGSWGYLDRIKLTLKRNYTYRGRRLSYFNAGCPAPQGAKRTAFPLALAKFDFAKNLSIHAKVEKACAVME